MRGRARSALGNRNHGEGGKEKGKEKADGVRVFDPNCPKVKMLMTEVEQCAPSGNGKGKSRMLADIRQSLKDGKPIPTRTANNLPKGVIQKINNLRLQIG